MMFSSATNGARRGGAHDDAAAGQALAEVVVGVALEPQRDAVGDERAEALPGRTAEVHLDRVVGQTDAAGRRVTSWPSIVPTVRLMLRIGS